MNTVAQLAKENAQVIFDRVEEHLLFISEFNTMLSKNMYSYLFSVNHFSVEKYRSQLDRIPNEKAGLVEMIHLNMDKLSGSREEHLNRILKHLDAVPVIKLQLILEALQHKAKLFNSNQVIDFALNFNFDTFLTDFYELEGCTLTEKRVTDVLLAKQLADEYISSSMTAYLQAKRSFKSDISATFMSNKLLGRLRTESIKFEKKFKELIKNNYILEFHYESHVQEKMKDFIEFNPNRED